MDVFAGPSRLVYKPPMKPRSSNDRAIIRSFPQHLDLAVAQLSSGELLRASH